MYAEKFDSPLGTIIVEADDSTVVAVRLQNQPSIGGTSNSLTDACVKQLLEYFCGTRKAFDLPLGIRGTMFQKNVWAYLLAIEYGKTATYSKIAQAMKSGSRAVGQANRLNNLAIVIPCHRVIGKHGNLTGYAWGLEKKRWLLHHELKMAHSASGA